MSLRARLLAAFAYVLVLVLVALAVPLAINLSRRVNAEVEGQASNQALLVAASAADRLGSRGDLDEVVSRAATDLSGRVIVLDAGGRLLADSAGSGLVGDSYRARPEVRVALSGQAQQGRRRSQSLRQDLLYTAVPILRAGQTVGAVRVTQSVAAVNRAVRRDTLALAAIGAIALVLGLAVAWLLAGSLARPLRALARTARRVASGDLAAREVVGGPSEQRDVTRAFNDMTDRLVRALGAQREFVSNASHQLRTPLTGLQLRLEAATDKSSQPEVRRELEAAEREALRLSRLLEDLLTLAAQADRDAEPEPVELASVARAAVERWSAPATQSEHRLSLAGNDRVTVSAAAGDVATILDNLVDNALKYSPPGGTVAVGWDAEGERGRVAISDEGPGIPTEDRHRVLERFYRGRAVDRNVAGSGLGLAIADALARRWNGEIRLLAPPGGGTRAELWLDLHPAEADLANPGQDLSKPLPAES